MNTTISVFQDKTSTTRTAKNISAEAFDQRIVRISEFGSPWALSAQKRLDTLTNLEVGWDGYRGVPVSFTIAIFALGLIDRLYVPGIPEPDIVPGSDGTLQIEWHINQYDVELDVLGVNNVIATRVNNKDDLIDYHELKNNFIIAWDWIQEL